MTILGVLFSPGRGHFTLPASGCAVHAPHFLQTRLFKCIHVFSISHAVTFTGGIYQVTLIAMWAAVAQFSRLSTQRKLRYRKIQLDMFRCCKENGRWTGCLLRGGKPWSPCRNPRAAPSKQCQSPWGEFSMTKQLHLTWPRKHQRSRTFSQEHDEVESGSLESKVLQHPAAVSRAALRRPQPLLGIKSIDQSVLYRDGRICWDAQTKTLAILNLGRCERRTRESTQLHGGRGCSAKA